MSRTKMYRTTTLSARPSRRAVARDYDVVRGLTATDPDRRTVYIGQVGRELLRRDVTAAMEGSGIRIGRIR